MGDVATSSKEIYEDKTYRMVADRTPSIRLIFFGDTMMRVVIDGNISYDFSAKQAKDICTTINEHFKVYYCRSYTTDDS